MTNRHIINSLIAVALLSITHITQGANSSKFDRAAQTLMYEVRATPSPLHGTTPTLNPPALMWPDQYPHLGPVLDGVENHKELKPKILYHIRLSQDSTFTQEVIQASVKWAFFNPFMPLKNGQWYWQYGYVTDDEVQWSSILSFTISPNTTIFSPPSLQALLAKLPNEHPRILLDKSSWQEFRENNRDNNQAKWYIDRAEKVLLRTLSHISSEIDTSGIQGLDNLMKQKTLLIRESRKIVDREEANIEALTRAYLLTKDQRYYEDAIQRIREILSWKESRYFAGDFNASVLLSIATLAYDAFYDQLDNQNKQMLLGAIRENGDLFYEEFVNHLENRIADNHVWQMTLRILTMAAFTVYGELPEANTWVDYCYNMWVARFPGLNDDGGWHNGDSYFHVNIKTLIEVPALYKRLTGFDFFANPWYNNSADYVIYAQPPFSHGSGQGNGHENVATPNATRVGYADALARECNNSSAAGYVQAILQQEPKILYRGFLSKPGDLTWYRICSDKKLPKQKSLSELPSARVFPETGLALIHSNLGDHKHNAMVSFRSSPYGSTSHALANQNAFNTYYAGKPIFYSSGHRTGFSDEHSIYSYRHTRAHNSILIDGMGQKIGTEGYGWVPGHYVGKHLSYVVGDASNGYGEVSSDLWLERARLSNISFSPNNGWDKNKLKRFRRHIVALGNTGIIVIYDDLVASEPVRWSFLLHTIDYPMTMKGDQTMSINSHTSYVQVDGKNDKGVSSAHLWSSAKIKEYDMSDQFFYPATNWLNKTDNKGNLIVHPNHFHFTATSDPATQYRFLTLIQTRDLQDKPTPIVVKDGEIRIGEWTIKANISSKAKAKLKITNHVENCEFDLEHETTILEEGVKHTISDQFPNLDM